jgi:UDP-3-O-[3-hydroxymyristoyl] glucosamine N-acyltransferase
MQASTPVRLSEIIEFLNTANIEFTLSTEVKEDLTFEFASMFAPVSHGFYFFLGDQFHFEVDHILLLVHRDKQTICSAPTHHIISIDANPQTVYYSLLSALHGDRSNGTISEHSIIHSEAIIGKNVQIDPFCTIGKATIGDNAIIRANTTIHDNTIIGEYTRIESGSVIGAQGVAWSWNEDQTQKIIQPQLGGTNIGAHSFLGAQTVIVRGSVNEHTSIGHHTMLAPGCRIGHGTRIGNYVHFANSVITGGNTVIGDYSFIGSAAVFRPKVVLHEETIVGAGAVVTKNTTEPGKTLIGVPAKESTTKANPSGMPKPKHHTK